MQGETMNGSSQPPSCGSWRLEREIGHGAYGVVYLAFSPDGEPAAVKVCRRDAVDPERYSRELRGAKLYCAVPQKEGLVWMRAFAETEWGFYAVMDLADDEFGRIEVPIESYRPKTLASVIKGEKALPLKECVNLAVSLSKGLAALQRHHLLHRDIKPANVLYINGRPVLSDPGLIVEESEAASLVGTPGYVPPEKFTDAASDVYSLGLTLKAASFGRQIEELDKGPAMESDTGAKSFPAWWRILNKATDPTPSRRYQSAKALLKEVEGLRRKMKFASIVELRIAKVALVLALLGVAAALVTNVVAGRRAEGEIARQSAENKALKDGMARQSEENRSLKDDLARQSK
ncbi:MAG: serine/threonine protein kinase, partial [Kiritimatiellae bacterium]|nr:serine/threonine protein kinase [Kiritimatiellia bacterium]